MSETLVQTLIGKLHEVDALYYRLLLLAAPSGSGKTACLKRVQELEGIPCLNVSLELSRQLLPRTERQRSLQLPQLLEGTVAATASSRVLLDNIELLFSPGLRQDPLRLLESLSRNRSLLVAWPGTIEGRHITYAEPGHLEHRRYEIKDFLVVDGRRHDESAS
ncbi:MAG TPA: BREX-3 system P-loop-containing protein BrxF [Phycisphaerae bacterium]|nr:BREX-3 system P-loop-containing protein BrxF [Phycisphaerae bacterium]